MGINDRFGNLFGGHNHVRSKTTNTERQAFTAKQAFIGPDAEIVDAIIKGSKPFITQNDPERNPKEFSTQADNRNNLDFSTSFSNVAQASVLNGFFMPSRLSGNDSRGSLRPFNSPNPKEEIFGAKLALIG